MRKSQNKDSYFKCRRWKEIKTERKKERVCKGENQKGKKRKNKENLQREGKKEKKGRVICDIRGHWFETLVQVLEITQIKNSYQKKFGKRRIPNKM